MAKYHRSFRALGALALLSGGGAGCHNTTLCEPTSAPLGQLVTSGVSEKYLAQVDKTGADVPHMACQAETTIITSKAYVRESEDGNCFSTGKYCLGGSDDAARRKVVPMNLPMDATAVESKSAIQVLQIEYRIVGIGQGVAIEDCSETALRACNAGHDAYYNQQRGVRPLMSGCRMAENQNMCEPRGRMPRVQVAATPEPAVSPEDQLPATWIARLGDVKKRPVAIRALIHFHTDAMMRSGQNAGDPAVKEVLDQIVEPLANVYVEGNLERSTRVLVIRFLDETRDPHAGRAFIHACHGFATATGPDEEDVQHAAEAIAALRFDDAAPALGEAFAKVEAGTAKGAAASKNIRLAMMQLKSAAWKPLLLEKIGAPMNRPQRSADAEQFARYQTQIFWQQTSAELLGASGDASATQPLLKVLMETEKAEIAGPALIGIVKIGRSAVPVLADILAGRDAQMVELSRNKAAAGNAKSYVVASAVALGAIGRADARAPMMQALKTSDNEMDRAVIARELTALPANAALTKAFQAGYDKVPAATRIWPSMSAARPALLAASARFYDSETVPWLLAQASAAKDKDEETMGAALKSAVLAMKGAHVGKVKIVVDKIGRQQEKSAFQTASELLGKCAEDVDCYLAKLKEGDASDRFVGVKAAHMVGMLGDTRAGMELVKLLPTLRQLDVRAAAVLAVDHAVQKDATTVADALQKLVEDPSGDGALASTAAEEVVYRLRAR
jgi:hypothetical protein